MTEACRVAPDLEGASPLSKEKGVFYGAKTLHLNEPVQSRPPGGGLSHFAKQIFAEMRLKANAERRAGSGKSEAHLELG